MFWDTSLYISYRFLLAFWKENIISLSFYLTMNTLLFSDYSLSLQIIFVSWK